MSFSDAIQSGFQNYVTFSGRARRSEYWFWALFVWLVNIPTIIADRVIEAGGGLLLLLVLALFLPGLAVSIRRLHDTGRSAWWLLISVPSSVIGYLIFLFGRFFGGGGLVMFLGGLVMLGVIAYWVYMLAQPSQSGANQYGPQPAANAPRAATPRPGARAPKPAWRETIDSFGGLWTIAIIGAAILIVVALVVGSRPPNSNARISTDALLGEAITTSAANHITDPALLDIPKGAPPVGGPHLPVPQATGVYGSAVPDGNIIHSLEHGIIWISYNPQKADAGTVSKLTSIAKSYSVDTILSPRPDNTAAITLASWGRLLQMDQLDEAIVKQFIETNRNRSPEPGVR